MNLEIPINVAIIPSVYCASRLPKGHPLLPSLEYYPYIHAFKGRNIYVDIKTDKKLISLFQAKNFEILQHGYSHELINGSPEFGIRDWQELKKRVLRGKRILLEAFEKEPEFFVAPHEHLSKEAFKVISKHFRGTFVATLPWKSLPCILPFGFLPSFLVEKIMRSGYYLFKNNFLVLETRGLYLLPYSTNGDILKLIRKLTMCSKIIVIVNHYWQYSLKENALESWRELSDFLIKSDCHFISCSNLYRKLFNK